MENKEYETKESLKSLIFKHVYKFNINSIPVFVFKELVVDPCFSFGLC